MNILMCDDNVGYLQQISDIVNGWLEKNHIEGETFVSSDIERAIRVAGFTEYQVAFLDVEMPEMSGLELATVLRKQNPNIMIVMVSNYTNYVYDAFSLPVYSYIYKEDMDIKIPDILDKISREINDSMKMFKYKVQRESYIINVCRIKYFQANLHHVEMYTENDMIEFVEALKEVEKRLDKDIFVRINRNNIINVRYIEEIRKDCVFLTGNVSLLLSGKYLNNVTYKRLQWYGDR